MIIANDAENDGISGITQSSRMFHDYVEDGLQVGWRACDHPQDLARRRLLLQCLAQVAVTILQLFEEANILDSNYGLIGKGLEQPDLIL